LSQSFGWAHHLDGRRRQANVAPPRIAGRDDPVDGIRFFEDIEMVREEIRLHAQPLRQFGRRPVTEPQFLGYRKTTLVAESRVEPRTVCNRVCLHIFTQSSLSEFCKSERANFG
jgi:hypothetical protein